MAPITVETMAAIPAPLSVEPILMTTESESASVTPVSSWEPMDVKPANPAAPTRSELLMEDVAASLASPTTIASAQNAPAEPSGAQLPANASMFADRTPPIICKLPSASVLMDLD